MARTIEITSIVPLQTWTGREQLAFEDATGISFDSLTRQFASMAMTVERLRKAGTEITVDNVPLPSTKMVYGCVFVAARRSDPDVTWDDVLEVPREDAQRLFRTGGGDPVPPLLPPPATQNSPSAKRAPKACPPAP